MSKENVKPEPVSFLFVTATSGSMETLIKRSRLPDLQEVIEQALFYYDYYIEGAFEKGPYLACGDTTAETVDLQRFDDERRPDHYDSDTVDAFYDRHFLEELTRRAHKKDVADMLTSALIVYESLFDALEAGLNIGQYTAKRRRTGIFTDLTPNQLQNKNQSAYSPHPLRWDLN